MSLGTLVSIKDLTSTYQPVLVCQFAFQDGTYLYASTHPLNSAEGGSAAPDYFGTNGGDAVSYAARVIDQSLGSLQAVSQQGIGRVPKVTLRLANADQTLWEYEQSPGPGFRGAILTMRLCGWQPGTSSFTTDAPLKFTGVCSQPYVEEGGTVLVVESDNSHNTSRVSLPNVPIQNRCPWQFPETDAQQLDGATNPNSPFYQCGYCKQAYTDPVTGVNYPSGIGNTGPANVSGPDGTVITDSAGIFRSCDLTRSSGPGNPTATQGCMARFGNPSTTSVAPDGDILHDESGHVTGRFGGVQYSPAQTLIRSRAYESGNWGDYLQYENTSVLGGYQNLLYGTQWLAPKVANVFEDANSSRCEAMISGGTVGYSGLTSSPEGVLIVTVNGVQVPWTGASPDQSLYRWQWISRGNRNGGLNTDAGYSNSSYSALSDPYGSTATVEIVTYRDLWDGGSSVNMQILAYGGSLLYWNGSALVPGYEGINNGNGTVTYSPVWVLLDLLLRSNFQFGDLDLPTFANAAAFTDTQINYLNMHGATAQHARYICEFALSQRRPASDVIDAVQRSFDAYLIESYETGKLQLFIRQTLADSQPSPITGSNYNTPISSVQADGTTADGYVAYSIDDSTLARDTNDAVQIQGVPSSNSDVPNEVIVQFQDSENQYQQDSLTQSDAMSMQRCGGNPAGGEPGGAVIQETLNQLGIQNFDQAYRVVNRYIWERNYGNENGDARGARWFEIGVASGLRVEHLRVGHLIQFSYQPLSISNQLFRVQEIKPAQNYESCRLVISWHEDEWYTDAFAQSPYPYYSTNGAPATRAPYPWRPNQDAPNATSFRGATNLTFGMQTTTTVSPDGSQERDIVVTGCEPINVFSSLTQPFMPLQGFTSASGGTIAGGQTIILAFCVKDSSGDYTMATRFATVVIPSGTNTNTVGVDMSGFPWPTGGVGWDLFAGTSELSLCHQASGAASSMPSSGATTIANLNIASYGLPDAFFHHFRVYGKQLYIVGRAGGYCTAVDSTSITVPGAAAVTATGLYVSLYSKPDGADVPCRDYLVVGQAGDRCFVSEDPTVDVSVGDAVAVRCIADIASSTTIGYSQLGLGWQTFYGSDPSGWIIRIVGNTGKGQTNTVTGMSISGDAVTFNLAAPWGIIPDSTSIWTAEEATWAFSSEGTALIQNDNPLSTISLRVNVTNYQSQAMLIMVQTMAADETPSIASISPFREAWIAGTAGFVPPSVSVGVATVDLSQGVTFNVPLSSSALTISNPSFKGLPPVTGTKIRLMLAQDGTGGRTVSAWGSSFATDVTGAPLTPTANARTVIDMQYLDDGLWHATSVSSITASVAAPPPVTITGAEAAYITDAQNSNPRLQITIPYIPPGSGGFAGVHVYLESPDQSFAGNTAAPMDGSQTLGGGSTLVGTWSPISISKFPAAIEPIVFLLDPPPAPVAMRFYLQSYTLNADPPPVQANTPGATPSVQINVEPFVSGAVSGEEFAPLITNLQPVDTSSGVLGVRFNLDGEGVTPGANGNSVSGPWWRMEFTFNDPSELPNPTQQYPYAGVQTVEYWNNMAALLTEASPGLLTFAPSSGSLGGANKFVSPWFQLVNSSVFTNKIYDITVYFVSTDSVGGSNTIVPGLTPSYDIQFSYPLSSTPVGALNTGTLPTGFTVVQNSYTTNASGQPTANFTATWTNPTSGQYGGSSIALQKSSDPAPALITGVVTGQSITFQVTGFPQAAQQWTFFLISQDANGNPNTSATSPAPGTPSVTITVNPPTLGPTGIEYTSLVTSVTPTYATPSLSDGTTQNQWSVTFGPPIDPTWGGAEFIITDNAGTVIRKVKAAGAPIAVAFGNPTSPQTYIWYLVSYDANGRENTISLSGPNITPNGSHTVGSTTGTLNGAWLSNLIVGGVLGSSSYPGYLDVLDASGANVAFIGVRTYSSVQYVGGWFKNLRVGGTAPLSAPFTVDSSGNVAINNTGTGVVATFVLNSNGITTSINNTVTDPVFTNVCGLTIVNNSATNERALITPRSIFLEDNGGVVRAYLDSGHGTGGALILSNSTGSLSADGNNIQISNTSYQVIGLYATGSTTGITVNTSISTQVQIVDSGANLNGTSLKISGTTVIDASRNGALASLNVNSSAVVLGSTVNVQSNAVILSSSGVNVLSSAVNIAKSGSNGYIQFDGAATYALRGQKITKMLADNNGSTAQLSSGSVTITTPFQNHVYGVWAMGVGSAETFNWVSTGSSGGFITITIQSITNPSTSTAFISWLATGD